MFETSLLGPMLVFGLAALGGVVWNVRLEGRVNAHDQLFEEREKLNEVQQDDLTRRLTRIETKLDQSLKLTNGRDS